MSKVAVEIVLWMRSGCSIFTFPAVTPRWFYWILWAWIGNGAPGCCTWNWRWFGCILNSIGSSEDKLKFTVLFFSSFYWNFLFILFCSWIFPPFELSVLFLIYYFLLHATDSVFVWCWMPDCRRSFHCMPLFLGLFLAASLQCSLFYVYCTFLISSKSHTPAHAPWSDAKTVSI